MKFCIGWIGRIRWGNKIYVSIDYWETKKEFIDRVKKNQKDKEG